MIKTFTQTDLIRYLYRETTEEETKEIDKALVRDEELMSLFTELQETIQSLDSLPVEPSEKTVQNILAYSRGVHARQA